MNDLGLRDADDKKVAQILRDAAVSMSCEIGIAGSLAQRALSLAIADRLRGTPLHDVDLLLIGSDDASPETPEFRKLFQVYEVVRNGKWYFGTKHRKTGMWVDFFSPRFAQPFAVAEIAESEYKLSSLESQILYLAHDLPSRRNKGFPVRRKWLRKLKLLYELPGIDQESLQRLYSDNREYFSSALGNGATAPVSAGDFVESTLRMKPSPLVSHWLFMAKWFLFLRKK